MPKYGKSSKRRFSRRRTSRKRTGRVSKAVKKAISDAFVRKSRDLVINQFWTGVLTVVPSTLNVNPLLAGSSQILQSFTSALTGAAADAGTQRIGQDLRLMSVQAIFRLTTLTGLQDRVRIMLVRYPGSAQQDIEPNDVLQTNSPDQAIDSWRQVQAGPYQVLYDKVYRLNPPNPPFTNAAFNPPPPAVPAALVASGDYDTDIHMSWRSKKGKPIRFEQASTTAKFTDISKGFVRLFICSDHGYTSVKPISQYRVVCREVYGSSVTTG